MNIITPPAGGSYLQSDGTNIICSKITTDDIEVKEAFRREVVELIRKEMGKVFLEMFLKGELPLNESAKKYFTDNL
jgi:hypothetical protein